MTYKISNFGRVWSPFKYNNNGIISPSISVYGYLSVGLQTIDNKRKIFYVHRLVAYAFIPNPEPAIYTEVNHINLNRSDCYLKI